MNFFGIGVPELVLILVVLLLLFGSKKLPDLARSIGQSAKEFKSSFTASDHGSESQPEGGQEGADAKR